MSDYPVLIVADSRGRHLETELQFELTNFNFQLVWVKGLRFCNTAQNISPLVHRYKPKLIYLLNGICDVTYVRTRNPRMVAMRDPCPMNTTMNYLAAADQLHSELYSMSSKIGHQIMVIFSTQTGVNLSHYNGYPEELISPEQSAMNQAMAMINRRIFAMNKSMGIVTPYLSSAVHMRNKGKFRFASNKLADGCHPTRQLCQAWAQKMRRNIIVNLDKYDRYALINNMYN